MSLVEEQLLQALEECINQACADGGQLDSRALSAYASAMRLLAKLGRLRITHEYGRRVIGDWIVPDA